MIDANAILGLIYSILQWFVIIGIIGILENKTKVDSSPSEPMKTNKRLVLYLLLHLVGFIIIIAV